ncbi:DUF6900 domain-containing protein [Burkholderia cepacia]|uniref:DUF6900 domain-containing protein n=1 Tax=Burkholderia cepacia TaxID=292 RepID=UPI002ABE4F3C|nr:hypothetical protein [Burkholderia cepacia]
MTREEFEALLETIAREHLLIWTLQERKSDRLDFHSVAVWNVRDALAAAYEAGRIIRRKPRE